MANTKDSVSSFLRDAFTSHAQYTASQKQDAQKRALKWLQSHIESELSEQKIFEQFTQKWRNGNSQAPMTDNSPLSLENLPGSYKGSKTTNKHQDEALIFLQEQVPSQMQADFQTRWDAKVCLKVSNKEGTPFKVEQQEQAILQKQDPDGNGTAWYPVKYEETYYLLSYEEQGDYYLVELTEDISPQNRNVWFVSQEDVKIANI
ncbi:hypothetical protein PCC7424_0384 [Gloeothece citriformis PCC 7424]|uniref:Uncharacterized protein n=1 Tax=Gloeothece citriformis (strain PCC 7424) TaxID=65393 RepID=B7KC28_GLOC7|nr:hypothetical protein [Gloeothece citriformis]ACK68851.1 hypothetical protein PCC7424_0384 [Gloeothece citriformis PCC 7424]